MVLSSNHLLSSCLQSCLVCLHCPVERVIDQWSCNYHGKSPESSGTSYRSVTAKPCLGTHFHLTTHNLQTSLSTSHTAYLLSILHILNLCSLDILGDSHHGTFILPEVTNVRTWGLKKWEGVYLKQLYYITWVSTVYEYENEAMKNVLVSMCSQWVCSPYINCSSSLIPSIRWGSLNRSCSCPMRGVSITWPVCSLQWSSLPLWEVLPLWIHTGFVGWKNGWGVFRIWTMSIHFPGELLLQVNVFPAVLTCTGRVRCLCWEPTYA